MIDTATDQYKRLLSGIGYCVVINDSLSVPLVLISEKPLLTFEAYIRFPVDTFVSTINMVDTLTQERMIIRKFNRNVSKDDTFGVTFEININTIGETK